MALSLTARGVASLKAPASGQRDVWDADVQGFGVRVSYGGRKAWVVRYRVKGRLRRFTLGKYPDLSLAKARKSARDTLHAVAGGKDPAAEKRAERVAETFAELATEYLERHAKPRKKSWREDERIINTELLPVWRARRVRELTRQDIRTVMQKIADRPAPIMANRVLALVRKMLNFALSQDWVEANAAVRIARPGQEHARDRVLTNPELRAVWAAFEAEPPLFAAYCQLRLLTAQRGGELRRMRWDDVDLTGAWWTIPSANAKNKLSHRVPLSAAAVTILSTLKATHDQSEWVFPSTVNDLPSHQVKDVVHRVQEATGIAFRGHDLRRTAASRMAAAGVSRLVIAKVLNHAEPGVTAVYDRHSYDWEKRSALDVWARQLATVLAEKEDEPARVVGFQRGRKTSV